MTCRPARRSAAWAALLAAGLAGGCGEEGAAATDAGSEAAEAAGEVSTDVGADGSGDRGGDGAGEDDSGPPPPVCATLETATIETVDELSAGRYSPAAARLPDGRVLIAGGYDFERGVQRSAELFDPTSDSLSPGGTLGLGRNFAAAAVLADGRVLISGGFHPTYGSDLGAEIYDPAAGTFAFVVASMTVGREAHTATRLPDGRVLLAGGLQAIGFEFHDTVELFDPGTGAFADEIGVMSVARAFQAAVPIRGGTEVLLVGGDSGAGELASAERYVAASGELWTVGGALPQRVKAPGAVLLDDGRVLVAGGANGSAGTVADAAVFVPDGDRFDPVGSLAARRMAHTLTRLADGRVLAVGGWSDSETPSAATGLLELFDPATSAWETLPVELESPRLDHVAVLLDDCRVLVAGGQGAGPDGSPAAPRGVELIAVPFAR